jgi:hypothetical protein
MVAEAARDGIGSPNCSAFPEASRNTIADTLPIELAFDPLGAAASAAKAVAFESAIE